MYHGRVPPATLVSVHGEGAHAPSFAEAVQHAVAVKLGSPAALSFRPYEYWSLAQSLEPIPNVVGGTADLLVGLTAGAAALATSRTTLGLPELRALGGVAQRMLADAGHAVWAALRLPGQAAASPDAFTSQGHLLVTVHDLVQEVGGYLGSPGFREQVVAGLRRVLAEAAGAGQTVVLNSHSLGSVVTFDALREPIANLRVARWFTLGSPLWLFGGVFGWWTRQAESFGVINQDLAAGGNGAWWVNRYDIRDPVAGALHDLLAPILPAAELARLVDVPTDNIGSAGSLTGDPLKAHDYWDNDQVVSDLAYACGVALGLDLKSWNIPAWARKPVG